MKKSQETEQKILDAALDHFFKKGYAATSINEITKSVGMTKGALYSHFQSKRDLLRRLFYKYREKFLDDMKTSVNNHKGDALSKLHHILSFYARTAKENLPLIILYNSVSHEMKTDKAFKKELKLLYDEQYKLITELIQLGIHQGIIKKELDPKLTALTFLGLKDGMAHHWALKNYHLDGRQFTRTMRQIFFDGITR